MELDWEVIEKAAQQYLDSKSIVLWGDYDLSKKDRKALAVEWLTQEVNNVLSRIPALDSEESNDL